MMVVDLLEFFNLLNFNEWILLAVSITALVPAIPILRLYFQTHISEYLLFCAVFVISSIFAMSFVLAEVTDDLLMWQIAFSARNTTYFLFFVHTTRMLWNDPPDLILYPGVILYAIVQFLILLWQSNPEGYGAGLYTLRGEDVFSTDYRLIANIFQLYVAFLFFYGYYEIQVLNPSDKVRNSKIVMMVLAVVLVGSRLLRLVQNFGVDTNQGTEILGSSILVLGFLLIGMIFIIYPSSIMLSRVQLAAIMVIAENGLPISSVKFKESELEVSPTLLSGIITAIDNVASSISRYDGSTSLREVAVEDRTILIQDHQGLVFSILTNSEPTPLLRSSLKYFAREFCQEYSEEISLFHEVGRQISEISETLSNAFPYSAGLTLIEWE